MNSFVFREHAGKNAIFASKAFDGLIGDTVALNYKQTEDGPVLANYGLVRLIKADVAEDGSYVDLTFEQA